MTDDVSDAEIQLAQLHKVWQRQHSTATQHELAILEREIWHFTVRAGKDLKKSRSGYLRDYLGSIEDECKARAAVLAAEDAGAAIWAALDAKQFSIREAGGIMTQAHSLGSNNEPDVAIEIALEDFFKTHPHRLAPQVAPAPEPVVAPPKPPTVKTKKKPTPEVKPPPERPTVTRHEAAKIMGCSAELVRKFAKSGQLHALDTGAATASRYNPLRLYRDEVEALRDERAKVTDGERRSEALRLRHARRRAADAQAAEQAKPKAQRPPRVRHRPKPPTPTPVSASPSNGQAAQARGAEHANETKRLRLDLQDAAARLIDGYIDRRGKLADQYLVAKARTDFLSWLQTGVENLVRDVRRAVDDAQETELDKIGRVRFTQACEVFAISSVSDAQVVFGRKLERGVAAGFLKLVRARHHTLSRSLHPDLKGRALTDAEQQEYQAVQDAREILETYIRTMSTEATTP